MSGAAGTARAKINLTLRVLSREESGYHQLETLFCALELADTIAIELTGDDIALTVRGADLGDPRGNLVFRAATAYFAAIDAPPAAAIVLDKRVPHGAGLGGGSSDAATTLRLLDALHDDRLGVERLLRLAGTLGADVPFFTSGVPAALAWGRGERLLPTPVPPARDALLVVPDTAMATAQAYAELTRRRGREATVSVGSLLEYDRLGDWDAIARLARNDFESIVFERIPGLDVVKQRLRQHGASPALLAGSGSALFAVFASADAAAAAHQSVAAATGGWRILHTRTATTLATIERR